MAESEFTLEIPVVADLTRFRAEVRAEFESAAKGLTVPVSTGAGGITGQQQVAVDRAMAQVQATSGGPRTPRGASASNAMAQTGVGGDLFSAVRNRVANAEAGLAEIQAARYIEASQAAAAVYGPTRVEQKLLSDAYAPAISRHGAAERRAAQADRSWDMAGLAQQKAGERRAEQFDRTSDAADFAAFRAQERAADRAAQQAEKHATRMRTTNADGLDPSDALESAVWDADWKAGAATERDQRGRDKASRAQARAVRSARMTRASEWIGANSARGLVGLFAVSSVYRAEQSARRGRLDAMLADSPEDAASATIRSIDEQTSDFYGSLVGMGKDILTPDDSPALMRERLSIELARMQSQQRVRQMGAGRQVGESIRGADAGYGRSAAEIEGRRDLALVRLTDAQSKIRGTIPDVRDLSQAPDKVRMIVRPGAVSSHVGIARDKQHEIEELDLQKAEESAQAAFDLKRLAEGRDDFDMDTSMSRRRFNDAAGGTGSRALDRAALRDSYKTKQVMAMRQFGLGAANAVAGEMDSALKAFDFSVRLQGQDETRRRSEYGDDTRNANALAAVIARLQTSGDEQAAGVAGIRGRRDQDLTESGRLLGAEFRDRNMSVGERIGRILPALSRGIGIRSRANAEEGRFNEGFDRNERRTDRMLQLSEETSGFLARGLDKTARAKEIEEEAGIAAEGLRGPQAEQRKKLILQNAINREKSLLRDLELQGLGGSGQQVASGTVAGFTGNRPNEEPLLQGIKEVKDAIERLNTALTGGG